MGEDSGGDLTRVLVWRDHLRPAPRLLLATHTRDGRVLSSGAPQAPPTPPARLGQCGSRMIRVSALTRVDLERCGALGGGFDGAAEGGDEEGVLVGGVRGEEGDHVAVVEGEAAGAEAL